MIFSDRLLAHIRRQKGFIPFEYDRDGVIKNLKFLYHACVASEQLLEEAGDAALDLPPDPFSRQLADYYLNHLEEERDEVRVLKEDLASVGEYTGLPDALSMAMVGSQYYLLKHMHPVCLLGYMAVQEADPSPILIVEQLEHLFGKDLFRFLRMHAIKDLEHRKELIALIDTVPIELHGPIRFSADNVLEYLTKAGIEFYGLARTPFVMQNKPIVT